MPRQSHPEQTAAPLVQSGSRSPRCARRRPAAAPARSGRPARRPCSASDRGLEEAGIERGDAYVTNVVKHFNWEPKGKLRLHAAMRGFVEDLRVLAKALVNGGQR